MKPHIKILVPLIVIVLISCVTFKPVSLDLSALVLEGRGQGTVSEIKEESDALLIVDKLNEKEISIRFNGEIPPVVIDGINGASAYEFLSRLRPDGPVEALKLLDQMGLSVYLGDGLRPGSFPGLNLEIINLSGSERIRISSPEGQWKVKAGIPADILIDGVKFTAYLLNTQRGDPQFDQPPFKADLILIRQ